MTSYWEYDMPTANNDPQVRRRRVPSRADHYDEVEVPQPPCLSRCLSDDDFLAPSRRYAGPRMCELCNCMTAYSSFNAPLEHEGKPGTSQGPWFVSVDSWRCFCKMGHQAQPIRYIVPFFPALTDPRGSTHVVNFNRADRSRELRQRWDLDLDSGQGSCPADPQSAFYPQRSGQYEVRSIMGTVYGGS